MPKCDVTPFINLLHLKVKCKRLTLTLSAQNNQRLQRD